MNLNHKAKAFFHGNKICKECYKNLTYRNKVRQEKINKINNRGLKCYKCGKPIGINSTNLCINCFNKIRKKEYDNL